MTARLMIPTRAALLAISLAGLVACSGPEKADEAAKPVALVTTAVLQRARLDETLTAFGAVEVAPSGERSLTAATEATVDAVLVSPGAEVTQGQPLVRLKPSPQAELDLKKAASDLDVADRALKRVLRLRATGHAGDQRLVGRFARKVLDRSAPAPMSLVGSVRGHARLVRDLVVRVNDT